MKILFYTIDMVEGVERLMPWRTISEAAMGVAKAEGYTVAICSAQAGTHQVRTYMDSTIYEIDYGTDALRNFVEEGKWEVVFYPISWRMGLKNLKDLASIPAKKIAYVPGGLYSLSGCIALWKIGGLKRAFPYLLEELTPHSLLTRKLKAAGFKGFIGQSPLTTQDAIDSGWSVQEALTALPGLDAFASLEDNYEVFEKLGLRGQKYLLFSGAPAQIRGSQYALQAFDRIADQLPDVKLVMLMRKDVSSDFSEFEQMAAKIRHKDQIIISYERMSPAGLKTFFSEAYAVLLPFLLVPSEIPLTYFEVMACGTPVISFDNEGTTDYLKPALKIAKRRSVGGLAEAMLSLCRNQHERDELARKSKELLKNHPTWEESAKVWIQAIKQSV